MKKLISLIDKVIFAGKATPLIATLVFSFGGSAIAQEIKPEQNNSEYQKKVFSNLGIPEKFVNYWEGNFRRGEEYTLDGAFGIMEYDIDNDFKPDVQEIYEITPAIDERHSGPIVYGFDLDGDNKFESDGEIIQDRNKDGFNGNEVVFRKLNPELEYSKL
jgi:hypothetical protein